MKNEPVSILLIEDDPAHAEIVHRIFEKMGFPYRLITIDDGQDALDYIERCGANTDERRFPAPNLILLDLRLPRVDGLDILSALKSNPQLSIIPVIVLTTSMAERDVAEAYSRRANSYLVKPVDLPEFTRMMEALGRYWLQWNVYPS